MVLYTEVEEIVEEIKLGKRDLFETVKEFMIKSDSIDEQIDSVRYELENKYDKINNLEDQITDLENTIEDQDRKIEKLENIISDKEEQNEKLKCCGNCKKWRWGLSDNLRCGFNDINPNNICIDWVKGNVTEL